MHLPSEQAAILGVVDPDVYAVGSSYSTGWVSAANFFSFMAVAMAGTLGTAHTALVKIEQATSSGGAGAKDVVSSATLSQAATSPLTSDKQVVAQCRQEDLDVDNGFAYVRATLVLSSTASPITGNSDAGAIFLGFNPRHGPASDNDAASVSGIATA